MEAKINIEDLDRAMDNLIDQLSEWEIGVKVEDIPLAIEKDTLRSFLKMANSATLRLLRKAVGVAYMRGHYNITKDDCEVAIELNEKGVEKALEKALW